MSVSHFPTIPKRMSSTRLTNQRSTPFVQHSRLSRRARPHQTAGMRRSGRAGRAGRRLLKRREWRSLIERCCFSPAVSKHSETHPLWLGTALQRASHKNRSSSGRRIKPGALPARSTRRSSSLSVVPATRPKLWAETCRALFGECTSGNRLRSTATRPSDTVRDLRRVRRRQGRCARHGRGALPVPALPVSGSLDAITPSTSAALVARTFPLPPRDLRRHRPRRRGSSRPNVFSSIMNGFLDNPATFDQSCVSTVTPIWTGSVGPKSLAVTGRLADGWIPPGGCDWLSSRYRQSCPRIDNAAAAVGRDPAQIATMFNFGGRITASSYSARGGHRVRPA